MAQVRVFFNRHISFSGSGARARRLARRRSVGCRYRVYTNRVNSNIVPFTLKPSTQTTRASGWVAMDANTGNILWTTADPSNETIHGPVTIVNGVLFERSTAPTGPVHAIDARAGSIIWTSNTGATVYGGASSSYGCIFVGHGYSIGLAAFHPAWNSGKYVFAFCIP